MLWLTPSQTQSQRGVFTALMASYDSGDVGQRKHRRGAGSGSGIQDGNIITYKKHGYAEEFKAAELGNQSGTKQKLVPHWVQIRCSEEDMVVSVSSQLKLVRDATGVAGRGLDEVTKKRRETNINSFMLNDNSTE